MKLELILKVETQRNPTGELLAKIGIATSEERKRERERGRERRGSSRLLHAANPLQIAANPM